MTIMRDNNDDDEDIMIRWWLKILLKKGLQSLKEKMNEEMKLRNKKWTENGPGHDSSIFDSNDVQKMIWINLNNPKS